MNLNLHDVIGIPSAEKEFSFSPDFSDYSFGSVLSLGDAAARGRVRNEAGILKLEGSLQTSMHCECARCLKEFDKQVDMPVTAVIADELQDEDNPDIFLLNGDFADLGEVFSTAFVLNVDQRQLCNEDCRGLCDKCGKNLNDGPCSCVPEKDPRLAVLGQFLEKD